MPDPIRLGIIGASPTVGWAHRSHLPAIVASPEFELLSHNVFADDKSRTNACPAVHNGQLLLRTDKFLYCVGE